MFHTRPFLLPPYVNLSVGKSPVESDNENNDEDDENTNSQIHRDNEQEVQFLKTDSEHENGGRFGLVVTVIGGKGLPGIASNSVFRRPNRNILQYRYVRVSVPNVVEGKRSLVTAETFYVAGRASECSWGSEGRIGEDLYLPVGREVLDAFVSRNDSSIESIKTKIAMEVELWGTQSEGGDDGILLGRGETAARDIIVSEIEEAQPQVVMLSLRGSSKGKIEIMVSKSYNEHPTSDGQQSQNGDGQELLYEQDIQAVLPADPNREPVGEESAERLVAESEGRGNEEHEKYVLVTQNVTQNESCEIRPKPHSPKWGLPRMVDFKTSLSVTLDRAANVRARTKETSANEVDPKSEDEPPQDVEFGTSFAEGDGERQSTFKHNLERQPTSDILVIRKNAGQEKQKIHTARHTMQSLKESLQAKLTEASGIIRLEQKSEQNEGMSEELQEKDAPDENNSGRSPTTSGSNPSSGNGLQPFGQEPGSSITLSESIPLDGTAERSTHGFEEAGNKLGEIDGNSVEDEEPSQAILTDKHGTGREPQENAGSTCSNENVERTERRVNAPKVDSPSPLRSLLRQVVGDWDVKERNGSGKNEKGAGEEDRNNGMNLPTDFGRNFDGAGSEHANGLTVKNSSAPVVASSMKAAAARLKTTLSSPAFTTSFKGFGWSKSKNDVEGDTPPPLTTGGAKNLSLNRPSISTTGEPKKQGKEDRGLGDNNSTPIKSAVTTILVTVFKVSDLPENLAKGSFGRAKKDGRQNPFIQLKVCDITMATSVVPGGGRECQWGGGGGGEIVEIPILSSALPEAELGTLKLGVEVWNKGSEEREKDILLGSTEILLIDWLGKKAAWKILETKRNQRGRVKLQVAVAEKDDTSNFLKKFHHKVSDDGDGFGAREGQAIEENSSTSYYSRGRGNHINIADALRTPPDENSAGNEVESIGMGTIAKDSPKESSAGMLRTSSGDLDEIQATKDSNFVSRRFTNNTNAIPHIDLASGVNELTNQVPYRKGNATYQDLKGEPRASENVVTVEAEDSNKDTTALSDGIGLKHQVNVVQQLMGTVDAMGGKETKVVDTKSVATADDISITILVKEADSLTTSISKAALGRPKNNPTQDLYVVLDLCGQRQATSATMESGSKCQWFDTAGEAVDLLVSRDDLTSAGWGQEGVEGPHVTLEIWNQMDPSRQGDIFIGSADIQLSNILGCGSKWVEISRRKKSGGRVKIDITCPALFREQSGPDPDQDIDQEGKGANIEKKPLGLADMAKETWHTSWHGLKGNRNKGKCEKFDKGTGQYGKSDGVSKPEKEPERNFSTDLPSRSASDEADKGTFSSMSAEREKTPLGADIEDTREGSDGESLNTKIAPNDTPDRLIQMRRRSLSSALLPIDDDHKEENAKGVINNSANVHVVRDNENLHLATDFEKDLTTGSVDGGSRSLTGGTATALNVAANFTSSVQQSSPISGKRLIASDTLATAGHSRDLLESDNQRPSELEYGVSSHTDTFIQNEGNSTVVVNEQDQELRRRHLKTNSSRTDSAQESSRHGEVGKDRNASVVEDGKAPPSLENFRATEREKHVLSGQQREKKQKVEVLNQRLVTIVALAQTTKRLERAREIARRRRKLIFRRGPVGCHRLSQTSSSLQKFTSFTVETTQHSQAARTIQGAFRGWTTRRLLRLRYRAMVKVQAAYRGHAERGQFTGRRARAKRATVEEKQARVRRSRIAWMQQVCDAIIECDAILNTFNSARV